MKEKWRAIANLLEEEFDIEVQPSYEGWGSGYDPKYLPMLEMWAKGEMDEVPPVVKTPKGVVFNILDFLKRSEDYTINSVRHEISLLLNIHFSNWRLGQREVFRAGYSPSSFVVLVSVLDSLKADRSISDDNPSSLHALRERYSEVLQNLQSLYPHHKLALSFLYDFLEEEPPFELSLQEHSRHMMPHVKEYLKEKDYQVLYDILMEDLWTKFRGYVDMAKEINLIDLLLDEARGGRVREDAHRGRIMTDVLSKLPDKHREIIKSYKDKEAQDMPQELQKEVLKGIKSLPDWMRDYLGQMSYIDMLERDISFFSNFLPKTLETDIEHRGFLSFLFKGWEEEGGASANRKQNRQEEELSDMDKKYKREHGLTEDEFKRYKAMMRSVLPYVEHFKRRFDNFLPQEEEGWSGRYLRGRRLNYKQIAKEVPIKRGRLFSRREVPDRKEIVFELLIDVSASMRKEEKIQNAIKALLLVSEVLDSLSMPFSIRVFNENVYELKSFEEDYRSVKSRIMELTSNVGGGTDLGKAVGAGADSLEFYMKKSGMKGIIVMFTDGQPTKGLKGNELKVFLSQVRQKIPIVAIGVGEALHMVKEYFDRNGINVEDISKLPSAFSFVMENQLKRLVSAN